jgi:hypothetical protein
MTGDESKRYEEAKTLNELYELIKFDYNLHIGEAGLSHYADAARRAYVRIRNSALAENPSLDISDVPQSADLGTVMDCCASALFTWEYLQSLSPDAKRRYLESLPDTKPLGASPDTLNRQQLRQFGEESAAIFKAKTLREIVPLWKRVLNNWEFIFVRYPSDPFAEKVSGQFTKSYLIKLAEFEPDLPMDFHISDYPDTFSGMKDLMMGLERALEKADNASTKPAETKQKYAPTTIININKLGVLGGIQQVETLQTGDNASAHKHIGNEEKKKGIFSRIPYWIYLLVSFLAALFACIHYWPEIHQKFQSLFSH